MKAPLKWLSEYVDIEIGVEELAKRLLNAGFEVEEIIDLSGGIKNVVTGKILRLEKHPNADKLQVCTIDVGEKEPVIICTAATNVFEGACIPVAKDGSVLAGGHPINATNFRGITSFGMLCSGAELGIDNSVYEGAETDGIMILKEEYAPGRDMLEVLGMDDTVLDISVTANRPDCQCVYGIAREISVLLNKPLRPLALKTNDKEGSAGVAVRVENTALCPRYMLKGAEGVRVAPSPMWMQARLRAVGIRPINNIVDITNYVLIEVGQPLHAFDDRMITGKTIVVRNAAEGETITALDGKTYKLKPSMLAICDAGKPVAIAGVMGGEHSGISADTKRVLIESARFARGSVRATSRALGLRSDSSARFEKGVDQGLQSIGLYRAMHLMEALNCGTPLSETVDAGGEGAYRTVEFPIKKISDIIGIKIPDAKVTEILNNLSIQSRLSGKNLICIIPPFRSDVEDFADIAEEVIRIYGYDKVKASFIKKARPTEGVTPESVRLSDRLRTTLCGLGLSEIITYSFVSPQFPQKLMLTGGREAEPYKIRNPLGEEYSVMRTTLMHNILSVAEYNLNHKNLEFGIFESGKVYLPRPEGEMPEERVRFSLLLTGQGKDFFDLKAICEEIAADFRVSFEYKRSEKAFLHPGISADIFVRGQYLGFLGQVHPIVQKNYDLSQTVYAAELDFELLAALNDPSVTAKVLPKFPDVERDIALVLDAETEIGAVIDVLSAADPLIAGVKLFDIYRGEQVDAGKMSAAFRITLRDYEDTLKDNRINEAMAALLAAAEKKCGAQIRQ